MPERLFGLEAELALSATRASTTLPTRTLVGTFDQIARRTLAHLPNGNRMFLANGGLIYIDCGLHPEVATPECTTPWEAVCHLRAGERLVGRLAGLARIELGADSVLVSRSNVDYVAGTTWGCHESYLGRRTIDEYRDWLVPHLASRVVYTGCGGLDPRSPGIRLSLSPRVSHIDRVVSPDSTGNRGIFHTRNESLCKGYSRIHVLAGDNACSHRSTWLKVGTTALIVALAEARPASTVRLLEPVHAMKGFARNLHHRARVQIGNESAVRMTATEVQRQLLARVEALGESADLPAWAPEVCAAWRAALDLAETPAVHASQAFDWPLKFGLFRREIARCGYTERMVQAWSDALERVGRKDPPDDDHHTAVQLDSARIDALRTRGVLAEADIAAAGRILAAQGFAWDGLSKFNALRRQLGAIDVRFAALESGIFESLDCQGLIAEHRMVSEADIGAAAAEPPPGTRAAVRGHWVRKLAGQHRRFACEWHCISGKRVHLDLSNPFRDDGAVEQGASGHVGAGCRRVRARLSWG